MRNFSKLYFCLSFIFIYGCQQRADKSNQQQKPVRVSPIQRDSVQTTIEDSLEFDSQASDSLRAGSNKTIEILSPESDQKERPAQEIPIMLSGTEFQDTPLQTIDLERDSLVREKVSLSVLTSPLNARSKEEKILVRMYNYSLDTLMIGIHYAVDFQEKGKWIKVAPPDNVGFVDVGYVIHPFMARDFSVALFPDRYIYPPGKYRVMKRYHILDDVSPRKGYEIFAEFEIK